MPETTDNQPTPTPLDTPPPILIELAALFLRLGLTAFGGPAAHVAMMREEIVAKRKWIDEQEFLDLLGASNLIPGPSSTELAIHIGYRLGGWAGLALAGVCFVLPAFLLVTAIAWAYVRYGRFSQIAGVLYGVKPVVIGVIVQAFWNLRVTALKTRFHLALGGVATLAALFGVSPLPVLFGAGVIASGKFLVQKRERGSVAPLLKLLGLIAVLIAAPLVLDLRARSMGVSLNSLFWVFLKFGSIAYGSGYVLLAFLRTDLVVRLHWLTSAQLLDATAVGQVTPGPVFTSATFIGYLLGGFPGAVVATFGIFLPAFVFVAFSGSLLTEIRKSPLAGAFLDGVNVGSLALMAAVCWELGRSSITDLLTATLALASLTLMIRFRINSFWLIGLGAIAGLIAHWGRTL